jgi:type IV secretory pathway ATPase VirB11/archaellum biosynthesis ATPase
LGLDRFTDRHDEVVALEAREANVEDVGRIGCADLVRWAMRMSANRVIIGEVLGDEIGRVLGVALGSLGKSEATPGGHTQCRSAVVPVTRSRPGKG